MQTLKTLIVIYYSDAKSCKTNKYIDSVDNHPTTPKKIPIGFFKKIPQLVPVQIGERGAPIPLLKLAPIQKYSETRSSTKCEIAACVFQNLLLVEVSF